MPIVRTYGCENCGYVMDVTLTMDQVDDAPPDCPRCIVAYDGFKEPMQQEFKPIAIGGSNVARANKLTEDILANDYGVANLQRDNREGSTPKVRYRDQGNPAQTSTWGATGAMLEQAVSMGRQTRMANGGLSGVDTLQAMLKSGQQVDLIEASKKRSMKVW